VLVAILESDAGTFCVPSKILSYLCSGRPIVISAPTANLSSRIVKGAAAGTAVAAERRNGFVSAVVRLLDEPKRRTEYGKAARIYAETHFDIGRIADLFLPEIVERFAGEP